MPEIKQVKIFSTFNDDPVEVENQINEWLADNPSIDIEKMVQTESGNEDIGFNFTLTILYKETIVTEFFTPRNWRFTNYIIYDNGLVLPIG